MIHDGAVPHRFLSLGNVNLVSEFTDPIAFHHLFTI